MTAPEQTAPEHTAVVSGNPRPGSRTLAAAQDAGRRLAALAGTDRTGVPAVIDLAAYGPRVLEHGDREVGAARDVLATARAAVVATPVYKASYTGLLKAFLDGYGPDALAGVVVLPLVVTGSAAHALAGEVHLRPVLAELGAVVPAPAVVVTEAELPHLDRVLDAWFDRWGPALAAAVVRPRAVGGLPATRAVAATRAADGPSATRATDATDHRQPVGEAAR